LLLLLLSLKVSDFFVSFGGRVLSRRKCVSHVSDFLRCLVSGIGRPSVIVFHVLSSVSYRFGFDTPNAAAAAAFPLPETRIYPTMFHYDYHNHLQL
jgi:hypothetical protein